MPWIKGTYTKGYRYLFPYDKDFIEVIFNDCNICDVAKICIRKEELLIKTIAKDVLIPENKKTFRPDVYFHNDRIFIAYEGLHHNEGTTIYSLDIISGKTSNVFSTPQMGNNSPFKPRFLRTANTIQYLLMDFKPSGPGWVTMQSQLVSLMYGKI